MTRSKPPVAVRLSLIAALALVASWDRNPLVRTEALLGLSPAPFERFAGTRTIFSGMTAAAHHLAHFEMVAAIRSNILSPLIIAAGVFWIATWSFPKATPDKEALLFAAAAGGSLIVDLGWRLLN